MIELLLVPLITTLSIAFFIKYKRVTWTLFLASNGFILYKLYSIYGMWSLSYSFNTGYEILGAKFNLGVSNNPIGWYFAFFSALITLIISIFSIGFNKNSKSNVSVIWMLIIFSNLGIFFAKDWVTFFMMWELMGWTSFFAITNGKDKALDGAKYYLSLSLFGAALLLIAISLLGAYTGTFEILPSAFGLLQIINSSTKLGIVILLLFLTTFIIKSAIFPFYMWPQKVYAEGPEDYITFMSSVMIKYGIYPMAIFIVPVVGSVNLPRILNTGNVLQYVIGYLGAISAVLGTLLAIFQTDMKKLFAYSSVSNMGYILLGFSSMTIVGFEGSLFHVVNHMILKAAIFLTLAAVVFRTGESEMHKLGGLVYRMPLTFMTFLLGIIAAAGIPPLNGFGSKWMIIQALMSKKMVVFAIAMIFASTGAFMYLFRALASIFLGQLPDRYKEVKEVPLTMAVPMFIMMVIMLLVGVVPGVVMKPLTTALKAVGYNVDIASWTVLEGSLKNATIDLKIVFYMFVAGVIISGLMYFFGNKSETVPQEDNYTAGEYPEEWGVDADRFNYSYSFYQPFKEMFDPLLESISIDDLFASVGRNFEYLSTTIQGLFKRGEGAVLLFSIGVLLLILGGLII
ncbi:proton-conducting transporter membrane subunit [Caloramator proteoclasticus]|uniref:NADH-quinone oxidoreductase subunit M n=1 Tax=Caloramator proteoclasticus DSM 10124 TaxID=1121262 RepID=A0A1M4TT62_9CLOT|nr:proton-conducting transporter membrane subunit [Caloramator proteoclasticus]SHE47633.1 NADH-quinone oxidoreductase subunit M [Caloramator proteoclasticus DSM 10124]